LKKLDTPAPRWEGVKIRVAAELEEIIVNYLVETGLDGVEIREPEPSKVEILAYIGADRDAEQFTLLLRNFLDRMAETEPQYGPSELTRFSIEDTDWSETWKDGFKPIKVGSKLVIAPSWEQYSARQGERVIIIDPGMAFGTGQHETTGLCLEALSDLTDHPLPAWKGQDINLLDVGCGSGILALAAVTLGVRRAEAIDNDPVAVEIACKNIEINGLQDYISARLEDIQNIRGEFRIITANIQLNILKSMSSQLKRLLAKDGVLIMSGILIDQQAPLLEAYADLAALRKRVKGEWAAVELARP